jgi:outer membrane receptor protein involved in Fe transport
MIEVNEIFKCNKFLRRNMKNIIILAVLLILQWFLINETNAQNRNKGNGTGSVTGIVLEKSGNSPLEGASVTLRKTTGDSSIVKGTQTDESGKFALDAVPFGRYRLNVRLVGYSSTSISGVVVNGDNPSLTLDTIKLKEGGTTTEEIEVTAERGPLQIMPDKKVFNVTSDIVNQSGSVTDVLRNIPSVTVDVDGNVSLRGSGNVKMLIDGKPSGLDGQNRAQILEQIPANAVESVELYTNPSAKFEAEGNSGIINIITKRNTQMGYNGNVTLGAGTKDKYNGGLGFNLKNNKINLSANYNFRLFNMTMYGNNTSSNDLNGSTSYINQTSTNSNKMNGQFGKASLDYYIAPKQFFTLSSGIRYRNHNENQNSTNDILDAQQNLSTSSLTNSIEDSKGTEMEFALDYNGTFNPKQYLTGDLSFSREKDNSTLNLNQQNFSTLGIPLDNPFLQNTYNTGIDDDLNGQLDYVHPFGEDAKFETGVMARYKKSDNDFTSEHFDNAQNLWLPDLAINNHFIYREQVYSAYGSYTGKFGEFGYQLGLRAEQTYTNGNLQGTGDSFNKKYFDLFPNLALSQQISKSDEVQINYSRRINRPRHWLINPHTDYSDPYNLRRGNPDLDPEYIDAYELSYVKYLGMTTITPSVFLRHTNNVINRIYTLLDSNTSLTTFKNIGTQLAYGGELIIVGQLTPWLNMNGNISYFRNELTDNTTNQKNSNYTWTARVMSTVRLPMDLSLQLSYNYTGENVTSQGTTKPMQSLDGAIRKDLFDKKASVSLRMSDIFNTQKFETNLAGVNFYQNYSRSRDSRVAFLTFTYNFGTPDKQNMRNKNKNKNNDDNNNEPDDIGY